MSEQREMLDVEIQKMLRDEKVEEYAVRFLAEQIPDMNWTDFDKEIHRAIDIATRFCDIFEIRTGKHHQ